MIEVIKARNPMTSSSGGNDSHLVALPLYVVPLRSPSVWSVLKVRLLHCSWSMFQVHRVRLLAYLWSGFDNRLRKCGYATVSLVGGSKKLKGGAEPTGLVFTRKVFTNKCFDPQQSRLKGRNGC